MMIDVGKFGEILVSRPAGHDAYLAAKAYLLAEKPEKIELDFSGVKVLTPSWLDEFLTPLQKELGSACVRVLQSQNPSVIASLATIASSNNLPFQ